MSARIYFFIMGIAAALGWITWFLIITNVNPFTALWYEIGLFYITLMFALLGTLFLVGWFLRARLMRRFRFEDYVGTLWRQSLFLTGLVIALLFLQSKGALLWWVALLPVAAFVMLEVFFVTYKRNT